MARTLWFRKDKPGTKWKKVISPSGRYGKWGSLEAYQTHLEEEGHSTCITNGEEPNHGILG